MTSPAPLPLGVPQRGHVHRVGQRLGARQQPRHVASRPSAGSPRARVTAATPSGAHTGDPAGQRADRRVGRRRRAALPAAAVHQPQHALVGRRGGPPRSTPAATAAAASAAGRVRAGPSSAPTASAGPGGPRAGRPRRRGPAAISKMPSPRTAARSSACSSGAAGSCSRTVERDHNAMAHGATLAMAHEP